MRALALAAVLLATAHAARWDSVYRWLHGTGSPPRAAAAVSPPASAGPAPGWVVGAGTSNRSFAIDYAATMMHRPELDLVAAYLRPTDVYLEFGTGGSTRVFPRMVKRAYAVEHDCRWAGYMRTQLDESGVDYSNLELVCVEVRRGTRGWGTVSGFEHGDYRQFREYVDRMDAFADASFDRVFIDGRARMACALKVLSRLKVDSLVFVHDFYARTPHYGGVLEHYEEVARVLATRNVHPDMGPVDEPQGLIVLRPKPASVGLVLSVDQIDAKYSSIDWRFPFAPPLLSVGAYWNYYVVMAFDLSKWKRIRSVEGLLRKVWHDMFVVSVIYAAFCVLSFRVRRLRAARKKGAGAGKREGKMLPRMGAWARSASAPGIGFARSDDDESQPRFYETEAMKMARARRKNRLASVPA